MKNVAIAVGLMICHPKMTEKDLMLVVFWRFGLRECFYDLAYISSSVFLDS
jgi:hypothetical protein